MSGVSLSSLCIHILAVAKQVPCFAPSQVSMFESDKNILAACHRLVKAGRLKQIRKGTQGNPSKLLTYKEPLFALNE